MSKIKLAALVPLLVLAACEPSTPADPAKAQQQARAAVSAPDPRLPAGFAIFTAGGDVQELEMSEPATGGKIFSFSILASPQSVVQFYEAQALAAGMTYDGRLNAGEVLSYEARKAEGEPKTFGATATRKGEYTNVTLMFDVTR